LRFSPTPETKSGGFTSSFSNFLNLKEALERLFQRPVDLMESRAIRNRRLRYYIDQSKPTIEQAFADEIFRVFALAHPKMVLHAIHSNSEVKRMIARAKGGFAPDAAIA
jgi:hypothetical protein